MTRINWGVLDYTGPYWWTFEEVVEYANERSKASGAYFTAIKGEPEDPDMPEKCWAITSKYDPKVIACRSNNND